MDSYDVIVVGAGYGGATCAALLAKEGIRTLLVEKNQLVGGKSITMDKEGFRYELWPITGGPALNSRFAEVLEELGVASEVDILNPEAAGLFMYKRDGKWREMVIDAPTALGPNFIMQAPDFFGLDDAGLELAFQLFSDIAMTEGEALDALDDVPVTEFIAKYSLPQGLKSFIGMVSNVVFVVPVDQVSGSEFVRTFRDFLENGTLRYFGRGYSAPAEVFVKALQRFGGDVKLGSPVRKIIVEGSAVAGVETASGEIFRAPIVVSNAGIQPTVLKLVGEQQFDKKYVDYVRGLKASLGIIGIRYFLDAPVFKHPAVFSWTDDNYYDKARIEATRTGKIPDPLQVFGTIPAVFDPSLAPPGKQVALMSTFALPDGDLPQQAILDRLETTVAQVWPDMMPHVTSREPWTTGDVSRLTREQVLPGMGGECIGLGQIVGQCGRNKPAAKSPITGLYYTGCDAGGYGCGTHQAVDSGANVAKLVASEVKPKAR